MSHPSFAHRLHAAISQWGHLCVGVDPHPAILRTWKLNDDALGVESFARTLVEAAAGRVPALKVQVAFFERLGAAGYGALERVLAMAAQAGLLVIADAKRGDIGSTMSAYAQAWLVDGSPLAVDALTLNPYTGFGSLEPAIDLAQGSGRGVYVLALTSNPEGAAVQHQGACDSGGSVAVSIMRACQQSNRRELGSDAVGVVLGATTVENMGDCVGELARFSGPVLVPGFGAQGADPAQIRATFAPVYGSVLVNSSRAIAQAGPRVSELRAAIDVASGHLLGNNSACSLAPPREN